MAPVKKKKGFFRRLRNLILTLSFLGALTFGGGVWYSRINDDFHDFFTEYVPFGEQAVLYLEDLDFRKRHPRSLPSSGVKDTSPRVKIAPQSGASWRVADSGEPAGRQSSAVAPGLKKASDATNQKVDKVKANTSKSEKAAAKPTEKPVRERAAEPAPVATKVRLRTHAPDDLFTQLTI